MEPNNNINLINPTPAPTINPRLIPQSAPVPPVPIVPPTPVSFPVVPPPTPTPVIPPFVPPTPPPPVAPVTPPANHSGGSGLFLTILGVLILVVGAVGYYWWHTQNSVPVVQVQVPVEPVVTQVIYTNTAFGYELQYPSDHTLVPDTSTSISISIADASATLSFTATSSKVVLPVGLSATTTKFAGQDVTLVMGSSTPNSFYKMIIVKLPFASNATSSKQWSLVIVESAETSLLDQVLSSFQISSVSSPL